MATIETINKYEEKGSLLFLIFVSIEKAAFSHRIEWNKKHKVIYSKVTQILLSVFNNSKEKFSSYVFSIIFISIQDQKY